MLVSHARNTRLALLSSNLKFVVKKKAMSPSQYGRSLQSLVPYYTRGRWEVPAHFSVFFGLSAVCSPALQPVPAHTQTLQHTVAALLVSCRLHLYSSCVVSFFSFSWHSISLIKSRISFTPPLLPSASRNFILWPPFSANCLGTSVYIAWLSVFVSILHLPYPVSHFITFFYFIVSFPFFFW